MRQSRAHDPARKRRGFFSRKRTNKLIRAPRVETVLDQERAIVDGAALIGEVEMSCAVITKTLKAIAPLLWSADYTDIVQEELACLAQMGVSSMVRLQRKHVLLAPHTHRERCTKTWESDAPGACADAQHRGLELATGEPADLPLYGVCSVCRYADA